MTEYRVADLARAAFTSVRNIRVYQDRGLLPPPRREGRIGLYGEEHLARLQLIGQLLGRGYTFATIGELFDAWGKGEDLADALGLRAALPVPWTEEKAVRLSRGEVSRRFGAPFSPAELERAVELGLLVPEGKDGTAYLVPNPSVFDAGSQLVEAGLPLAAVLEMADAVQDDLARAAQRFMAGILSQLTAPDEPLTDEQTDQVRQLRPHLQATAEALLRRALQQESERLLTPPGDAGK